MKTIYLVVESFNEDGDPEVTYHAAYPTYEAAEAAAKGLMKAMYDQIYEFSEEDFDRYMKSWAKFLGVGKNNGWTTFQQDCTEIQIIPVQVLNS